MKNKVLILGAVVLCLMLVIVAKIFVIKQTPEKILHKKYADCPSYTILASDDQNNFLAYLGKDNERFTLDIFRKGKFYWGVDKQLDKIHKLNSIDFFYFMNASDNQTLVVVYGENPDLMYSTYHFTLSGTQAASMKVTKNIKGQQYIVDVYVFDDMKYNGTPDLTFTQVNEN